MAARSSLHKEVLNFFGIKKTLGYCQVHVPELTKKLAQLLRMNLSNNYSDKGKDLLDRVLTVIDDYRWNRFELVPTVEDMNHLTGISDELKQKLAVYAEKMQQDKAEAMKRQATQQASSDAVSSHFSTFTDAQEAHQEALLDPSASQEHIESLHVVVMSCRDRWLQANALAEAQAQAHATV